MGLFCRRLTGYLSRCGLGLFSSKSVGEDFAAYCHLALHLRHYFGLRLAFSNTREVEAAALGLSDGFDLQIFGEGNLAVHAFGLDAAEFVEGTEVAALGSGAGAVDRGLGALEFGRIFVASEFARFDVVTAAEAPCGVDDLVSEAALDGVLRGEVGQIGGDEVLVLRVLVRCDEGGSAEQAKFDGIVSDAGLAFLRPGTGGKLRVGLIGGDLGFCGQ